jgi:D-beta-D-heptose 7-phosphate kinase/D-beta-D-heptose 1-phosphate adenosyltransferase
MKSVCISGGFDPVHGGHIDYIEGAFDYVMERIWFWEKIKLGIILNSDEWLIRKKGYCFMPYAQRKKILEMLWCVDAVFDVDDSDGSVCEALHRIHPDYFANGGDRVPKNTLELDTCNGLGIIPIFGIGGEKTESSSELVRRACETIKDNEPIDYAELARE